MGGPTEHPRGLIAQLAEHSADNRKVGGSNPPKPTNLRWAEPSDLTAEVPVERANSEGI
jgi:hypothetical protein